MSQRIDRELLVGSSAHYEDPDYYARAYMRRRDDVAFYEALATDLVAASARAADARILEYGCGEGRITVPMARAGASVFGVDASRPMLQRLRERLGSEPTDVADRVQLRHGNMCRVRLEKRFPLVLCTFNTLLHLYGRVEIEQFFARVRAHLAPGGRFVFDVTLPYAADLARPSDRAYKHRPLLVPSHGRCAYQERFDYDPIRQVLFMSLEFEPLDGSPSFRTPLTQRMFYPQELEALLHYNGLTLRRLDGGFEGQPADRYSEMLVFHCEKRAGFRPR